MTELTLLTIRSAWKGILLLQGLLLTPPAPLLFGVGGHESENTLP